MQHNKGAPHVRRLSQGIEGSSSQPHTQESSPRRLKRTVVYNACENCRLSKSKCSGKAPCERCLKSGHNCTFTGRALDRASESLKQSQSELVDSQRQLATARHDLLTSRSSLITSQSDLQFFQSQLASVQQDLHVSRQLVATLQQQVDSSQRDLTTSQLDLMMAQHQGRIQAYLLDDIFKRLKVPNNSLNPDLKELALQSRDSNDFMEKLSTLPDQVKQSIGSSLPWDIMSYRSSLRRNVPNLPISPSSLDGKTGSQEFESLGIDHHDAQNFATGGWQSQVDNALSTMAPADEGFDVDGLQHFSLLSPDYAKRNQP